MLTAPPPVQSHLAEAGLTPGSKSAHRTPDDQEPPTAGGDLGSMSRKQLQELAATRGIASSFYQRADLETLRLVLSGTKKVSDYAMVFGDDGAATLKERTRRPSTSGQDSSGQQHPDSGALVDAIRAIASTANQTAKIDPAELQALSSRVEALESGTGELAGALKDLAKAVKERQDVRVTFEVPDFKPQPVDNPRPEVAEMLRRVNAGLLNLWVAGPAGSGKSTLGETLATALGLRFASTSLSPDLTAATFLGTPTADGRWNETTFIDLYESGGVFLLDEIDNADASILVVLNQATANGWLAIPRHPDTKRRMIKRHASFVLVAAGNTWGTGPTAQYCGRAKLDAATLNRFTGAQIFIGYDRKLEERIMPPKSDQLLARLWRIRDALAQHKIHRIMGTRDIAAAGRLFAAGFKPAEILDILTIAWTPEEKAKALVS